jgi:uncharacterized protein (TIGR03083 family)
MRMNEPVGGGLDGSQLLEVLRSEGEGLAGAFSNDLEIPLPRYPDWSLRDLLTHTGSIHRRTVVTLRERKQEPVPRQYPGTAVERSTRRLREWFDEGLFELCDLLASVDLALPVWSFSSDRTARFWLVRMAVETAVHRVDAEMALGVARPVLSALAVCGVDEFALIYLPEAGTDLVGDRRHVLLVGEDVAAAWRATVGGSRAQLERSGPEGAVEATVRASASELYLALTGRIDLLGLPHAGDIDAVRSLDATIKRIPDANL